MFWRPRRQILKTRAMHRLTKRLDHNYRGVAAIFEPLEHRVLLAGDVVLAPVENYGSTARGSAPCLVAADVNDDGSQDFVYGDIYSGTASSGQVRTLLNRGDGTFEGSGLGRLGAVTGCFGAGIGAADFNGDDQVDIVTTRYAPGPDPSHGFYIFLNRGPDDGNWLGFDDPISLDVSTTWTVTTGDFDEDGDVDIVQGDGGKAIVMLNQGTIEGEFQGFTDPVTYGGPGPDNMTVSITAEDMNADGHLDLVMGDYTYRHVTIQFGRGDGTFRDKTVYSVTEEQYSQGFRGATVAVHDLNGDGAPDVAFPAYGEKSIALLFNDGTGTLSDPTYLSAPDSRPFTSVEGGDLDGDGDIDLVGTREHSDTSYLFLNQGDGSFVAQDPPFSVPGYVVHQIIATDLNGDGLADLAMGSSHRVGGMRGESVGVSVFINETPAGRIPGDANGDGIFNSSDLIKVFQAGEYEDGIPGNSTYAEGDWNEDGDFDSGDLVVAFQAGTYVARSRANDLPL